MVCLPLCTVTGWSGWGVHLSSNVWQVFNHQILTLPSEPCLAIVATFTAGKTESSRDTITSSGKCNFWTVKPALQLGAQALHVVDFGLCACILGSLSQHAADCGAGCHSSLSFCGFPILCPPPPASRPLSLLSVICSH